MNNLNIADYETYHNYITTNPNEVHYFLDKFTINYTYFFRNYEIYKRLEQILDLSKCSSNRIIKVWSCPCASGEEPYSIAMLFDYLKKLHPTFSDFRITASDIDKTALKMARKGIYNDYSIHDVPENYLNTYFLKKNTQYGFQYEISKEIKDKVELIEEDVIEGHKKNVKYDIIFCRNLFIYIKHDARERLIKTLESHLLEGGLLILGGTETLTKVENNFRTLDLRNRFYIKNTFNPRGIIKKFEFDQIKKVPKQVKPLLPKPIHEAHKHEVIKKRQVFDKAKFTKKEKVIDVKLHADQLKTAKSPIELSKAKIINKQNNVDKKPETPTRKDLDKNKKDETQKDKKIKKEEIKDVHVVKVLSIGEREELVKERERIVRSREILLQQHEEELEKLVEMLNHKEKDLENLRKQLRLREKNIKERTENAENLIREADQKVNQLKQREKQVEHRVNQMGNYTKNFVQHVKLFGTPSKEEDKISQEDHSISSFEKRDIDRAMNPNDRGELILYSGYYGLINSFDQNDTAKKLIINNLGSGIALIMKDPKTHIFAMSNIALPNSSASKQDLHIKFPHIFADTSVKDLFNNLIYHGAKKDNIKAHIIGGARMFSDYDLTYQENIDTVKNKLNKLQIEIESEDIGGLSERKVSYDTINDIVFVKKSWEFEYRKI